MNAKKHPYKPVAGRVVDYFKTKAAVARALGYSDRRNVAKWVDGELPFPPKHCVLIEQKSGQKITRQQLRPLDYAEHWPELAEKQAGEV